MPASGSRRTGGLTITVEDAIAGELGLAAGELLLDFPAKTEMLGLDLPLVRRGGEVRRLTARGLEGAINLPTLSEQLYRSARWLRVFIARPVDLPRDRLLAIVRRSPEEIRWHLGAGDRLLG